MEDLFEREQKILEHAMSYLEIMKESTTCSIEEYASLVDDYRRLLKQIRRITRISDKTTIDLNTSKLDLLDKIHYDELTGIYNRRFLYESLTRTIKALCRVDGILGLLMIDVDYFKRFNDTYGHNMGDDCLKAVASAIHDSILRPEDFVARYGGEEFVAVLPDTNQTGACVIAERIRSSIENLKIPHENNEISQWVTVSIGVTAGPVCHQHTADDFIIKADKALYCSKQKGRNQYTFINS